MDLTSGRHTLFPYGVFVRRRPQRIKLQLQEFNGGRRRRSIARKDSYENPRNRMAENNRISSDHDLNAKWDACLDLSLRRVVYSSLAGSFGGLLLFRQDSYPSLFPVSVCVRRYLFRNFSGMKFP